LLVVACSKPEDRQSRARPIDLNPTLRYEMRNCPSAVAGARTVSRRTPDGVQLMITADQPAAQQRIITLARLQAGFSQPIYQLPPHTGMHSGPGTVGRCPVVHANTIVTTQTLPRGAVVNVRARDRAKVPELQAKVEERVGTLRQPSS
jgi:TusA-related sulfurtransferase